MSLKKFVVANNLDESRVLGIVLGEGGTLLPCNALLTGYYINIGDDKLTFYCDKFDVKEDVLYSDFQYAEFGIGNGNLWLQCRVKDSTVVFCMARKLWESEKARLLMDKISAVTELKDKEEYDKYTGKLFFLYMFK